MPDLYLAVMLAVLILATIVLLSFIIRRHLLFAKYIKESNIPFLPIQSYARGSWNLIFGPGWNYFEKANEYSKSFNTDTLGAFLGPVPMIFTKDLDLIKKIWITDSQKHINRDNIIVAIPIFSKSIMGARDDNWRRVRRCLGSIMTPLKLKKWNLESDIDACLSRMMLSLSNRLTTDSVSNNGQQSLMINTTKLFKEFTMDIALESNMRQSNKIDYDSSENEVVLAGEKLIEECSHPLVIWTMYLPALMPIVSALAKVLNFAKFLTYIENMIRKVLVEKAKSQGAITDKSKLKVVDSLLELYNQKKINKDELVANGCIMLVANWDTTGETLTSLMWNLAKHRHIQEKLRQDIMKNGIESQYLDWTLKEVLRLHPPATTSRVIGEDFTWKGYKIMKGMNFALTNIIVQRDENIWGHDVLEFRPERFERSDQFHMAQYCPFGLGPRICLGYHSAMATLKNFTVRMILDYSVESCEGTPDKLKLRPSPETALVVFGLEQPIHVKLVKLNK